MTVGITSLLSWKVKKLVMSEFAASHKYHRLGNVHWLWRQGSGKCCVNLFWVPCLTQTHPILLVKVKQAVVKLASWFQFLATDNNPPLSNDEKLRGRTLYIWISFTATCISNKMLWGWFPDTNSMEELGRFNQCPENQTMASLAWRSNFYHFQEIGLQETHEVCDYLAFPHVVNTSHDKVNKPVLLCMFSLRFVTMPRMKGAICGRAACLCPPALSFCVRFYLIVYFKANQEPNGF